MFRMPTLIQQSASAFLLVKNRDQHRTLRMMLAKVIAKSALSVMNWLHTYLLLS